MTRRQAELTYFAIAGALVGPGYWIGRAWWAGDIASAFTLNLVGAAAVGAVAGVLASLIRGSNV